MRLDRGLQARIAVAILVAPLIASLSLPHGADIRALNQAYAPVIVALIYLPCLILILRRKEKIAS
jgi:hypothetical protein